MFKHVQSNRSNSCIVNSFEFKERGPHASSCSIQLSKGESKSFTKRDDLPEDLLASDCLLYEDSECGKHGKASVVDFLVLHYHECRLSLRLEAKWVEAIISRQAA